VTDQAQAAQGRKKVGISMPVANEETTIRPFLEDLIRDISPIGYSFTVYIIMDNFSRDNTLNIVKEISEKDPRIRLVFFKHSTGVVSCYLKGFKCALEDGCDYIIEMDSGGSHPPSKIKDILHALDRESYDVAFMSRFMKEAGIENFPLYRRLVSKGGTVLANLWLGMHYSDATSGFEAFRAEVLKSFDLDAFISTGGIYQTEMKYYCSGFRHKEIPFVYMASTTAFKPKWIWTALKTLFRLRQNKKRVMGGLL
jgi:glycosyltransferase involved in cell wall biosynthesis